MIKTIAVVLLWAWVSWMLFLFYSKINHQVMKYDCRIAEISVDYPQAVKEQCRRIGHD